MDYGIERYRAAHPDRTDAQPLARVVAQHKGLYRVAAEAWEGLAEISGSLRRQTQTLSLYPAVGDYVTVTLPKGEGTAVIHEVLPRFSAFERKAVGLAGQSQVVAANVDVVFLCMSLNQNYNLNRLERYLTVGWNSGATPVCLLTKADLCPDTEAKRREAQGAAGCAEVLFTSAFDEETRRKLFDYITPGTTASFIGSSGAGKSTLINLLLGREVQLTAGVGWQDHGRHTTTARELLPLPNGGMVVDTPGMRELGVEAVDLSRSFADIDALAAQCRFSDCTHTAEPGCAVQRALADGTLAQRRYDHYLKLKKEAAYDGLNYRELETVKLNDMFKDVGGMKGMRKFNRQNGKR